MRSIPLLAATTVILLSVGACGDDGGVDPSPNPTAGFSVAGPCTVGVACAFTDASSDPQGATTITTRSWDFNGDGTEDLGGNQTAPTFIYQTEGTFQAKLTVTDNTGNSDDVVVPVTVNAASGGVAPVASMETPVCTDLNCLFVSTSTDDQNDIASTTWDFGDPNSGDANTAEGINVEHSFSAAGTYTVTLTVTDGEGLSHSTTQSVTVTGGATGQSCSGTSATDVTCTITLAQRSSITITLESEDCEIGNNNLLIPPPEPRAQIVFFNLCNQPVPQEYTLTDNSGTGAPLILEAGTQLPIVFRRGSDPVAVQPQARITSTGANTWSIAIDDGGNPGGPGEPDFQDVILTVTANPQP